MEDEANKKRRESDQISYLERLKQERIEEQRLQYQRYKKFEKRSLFFCSSKWRLRQQIIRLLRWRYYDYFMIFSIIGNSVCLALTDYSDDDNQTEWNQALDRIDIGFTVVYATEAILKVLAFGFIMHRRSYLRDPWNILDFIVVIIGLVSLFPAVPNLKSLRTMRILRPLRSINAVPSMKRLVAALLMSLPQMGYLVSFLFFFIGVFAILGMQMFARDLYFRCRLTDRPTNNFTVWAIDPNQNRLCGGIYECNPGTYCHSLIEYKMPLSIDHLEQQDLIQYGYFTFDNIGVSILSIFRVITLEGWSNVMYNYLDSSGLIAALYFPILIIIGSFFLLNLFLAVIMETFSQMNEKQKEKDKEKEKFKIALINPDGVVQHQAGDKNVNQMMKVAKKKIELTNNIVGGLGDAALILRMKSKEINENSQKVVPPIKFRDHQQISGEGNILVDRGLFALRLNNDEENMIDSNRPLQNSNYSQADMQERSLFEDFKDIKCCSCVCLRVVFLKVCESQTFTMLINVCIVSNTLVLGLDQYPQDVKFQQNLDIVNIVFFVFFFFEMVIKLLGLGPVNYIKDSYNVFDCLVVTLSIVDVSLSYSTPQDDINNGLGAISAFRAFRLLRVFKLAKSWRRLKLLLQTIARSLKDISSFSVLLFLLMFIYILLGMEIFAQRGQDVIKSSSRSTNRTNFNTFFNGFIVVFSVLTGENWDETMFTFAKQKGYIAIFFFISLVIVGVMIFLNLFLAILLENFEVEDESDEESIIDMVLQYIQDKAMNLVEKLMTRGVFRKKQDLSCTETNPFNGTRTFRINNLASISIAPPPLDFDKAPDATQNIQDQNSIRDLNSNEENEGEIQVAPLPGIGKISNLGEIKEQDEDRSPSRFSSDYDNHLGFTRRQGGFSAVNSTVIERFGPNPTNLEEPNNEFTDKESGQGTLSKESKVQLFRKFNTFRVNDKQNKRDDSPEFASKNNFSNDRRSLGNSNSGFLRDSLTNVNQIRHPPENHNIRMDDNVSVSASPSRIHKNGQNGINFAVIMYSKTIRNGRILETVQKAVNCEGNSLLMFGSESYFRIMITKLVKSRYFEGLILVLIGLSSILLALDNPLNNPNSGLVQFLIYSDYILTAFFAAESIFKIISQGLIFNGKAAYLRTGWNVIDFIVVIVSVISLSITSNKLKIVKILRLLRVLRPLRVISRNKGLKIGIQALFMAIPSIINVIIVSMVFFLIFGIIGVNYFKGTFFNCQFGDNFPYYFDDNVVTKWDCLNFGGAWLNADQNFDNVAEAMSTLFQVSTTEGWIDMMNRGIDSVDIDMQPVKNNNMLWAIFYMVFIVLGNFLILNLFVGVVISTFNREKEILGKGNLLSKKQKDWLEMKQQCMSINPKVIESQDLKGIRGFFAWLVMNRKYDIFILVCIIFNTLVLAINWYSQPVFVDDILDYINYSFAVVFFFEASFKLIAFGPTKYFKESGNSFDFLIVFVSVVSSIVSILLKFDFGASTTFIRALRITRIFKYIKKSKQIQVIFETLVVTIPALTNIGGLLLLFLYIYSVLGVFLFAEIQLQSTLNIHANFQSFGVAFLTLLRCSTGEAWHQIMMDSLRQANIMFQCSSDDFDYDVYEGNGFQTTGCGSQAGIIFFTSYFLMVPLIFLNLFIAIILEGFEQTSQKVNSLLQEEELEHFRDCWVLFDKEGTGFMKISEFPEFMMTLGEPMGWDRLIFQENIDLQDDCLEELFMNVYNDFTHYQFWDVLINLMKVYLVNNHFLNPKYNNLLGLPEIENDSEYSVETETNEIKIGQSPRVRRISSRMKTIDPDEKLKIRLELEFEMIDDSRQDVMDVEDIKIKEKHLRKQFENDSDSKFNSAHIKAARKILKALKRLYENKQMKQSLRMTRLNEGCERKTTHNSPQPKMTPQIKRN